MSDSDFLTPKEFSKLVDEYPGRANLYFLERCSETNSIIEIEDLIRLGIDLHEGDTLDRAFVDSCCSGNINITLYFLDKGANINALNGQALVRAVSHKQWDILKMLLNMGIKMTSYNIVHISYLPDYQLALEMLLDHGISESEIAKLLLLGLVKNKNHQNAFKMLIEKGADMNKILF